MIQTKKEMLTAVLDENSLKAYILGDPMEPTYCLVFGTPVFRLNDGKGDLPTGVIGYVVFESPKVAPVGSGLIKLTDLRDRELPFYLAKLPEGQRHTLLIEQEQIRPKYRGLAISEVGRLIREANDLTAEVTSGQIQPTPAATLTEKLPDEQETYREMVLRLQKPMKDFRFTPEFLMAFTFIARQIEAIANDLDVLKKACLYEDLSRLENLSSHGQKIWHDAVETVPMISQEALAARAANFDGPENEANRHLLHHMIGMIGEYGGELSGALVPWLMGGPLNVTNVREEMGDGGFYHEGARAALGITLEQERDQNRRKLVGARYKNGFTNEAALHRDLDAEAAQLKE